MATGESAIASPVVVRLRGISKRFGDVVAIDNAALDVARGEVHALLGENGAGKTSIMNVLAGVYRPDAGEVELDGHHVTIRSPQAAKGHGIGMVHPGAAPLGTSTAEYACEPPVHPTRGRPLSDGEGVRVEDVSE